MFNQTWFHALLIIAVGFSAYSFMLHAPFRNLDDQFSIVTNPLIHDSQHIKEIFTQGYFNDHSYYRPLVNLSFMGEYHFFGLKSFFYNLDNLFLHSGNAFLVWILVGMITESTVIGFWAGFLFILHPIHVEAVSNISGRSILLGAAFSLSAFICFLFYEQKSKTRFLLISVFLFALGLLCKESVAVLPGIIFVYLWTKKKSVMQVWPYALVIGSYIALRCHLGILQTVASSNLKEHIGGVTAFLYSLLTDLKLFLFPVDLYFDRSQRVFLSFTDPGFVATVIIWTLICMFLIIYRQKITRIGWFLLSWFVLEMLLVSQILTGIGVGPGYISCANHFLYLASIPIFVILIYAIRKIWQMNQESKYIDERILKAGIAGFLIFLFLINVEQNIYASNEISLLERSLKLQPINARVQSSLGLCYALGGKPARAQSYFLQAVMMDPMNVRYRISLGKSICDQGRYQECLDVYNQIKDPGSDQQLLNENKKAVLRLMEKDASVLQK